MNATESDGGDFVEIIGGVLLVLVIGAVFAGIWWMLWGHNAGSSGSASINVFQRSPEIASRGPCVVTVRWRTSATEGTPTTSLVLIHPDGQEKEISTQVEGEVTLDPNDASYFSETGTYRLRLSARPPQGPGAEREIGFFVHTEDEFDIRDSWNTGLIGGGMAENDTVAYRSLVLAGTPYTGTIAEIDSKVPGSISVCPKGIQLKSVTYDGGTIDGSGMRRVTVKVRKPGASTAIAEATLSHGETLVLPVPVVVGDGLEVLSSMRAPNQGGAPGSEWNLIHRFERTS